MKPGSSGFPTDLRPRDFILVAVAVLFGVAAYVLSSALTYRIGFPLDNSWIHAVYARNLALHGDWAFQLGHPSAGSTAPLWTFLLVPGFWLRVGPVWWSFLLGSLALYLLSLRAETLARALAPAYRPAVPWIGLFLAGEWHMVWAAASGMETSLHALLLTVVIALLLTRSRKYVGMGLLTGLSVWTRPDGLTLIVPALAALLLADGARIARGRAALAYLLGFGTLFLPYVALNVWLSGTPMPNTFYAKQVEYAAWQLSPLSHRLVVLTQQLVTGPAVVLVPGLIFCLFSSIRRKSTPMLLALGWCVSYFLVYIVRLPAYQHGRYLMPAMPTFFVLAVIGYLELREASWLGRFRKAFRSGMQLSLAALTVGFFFLGARAYGQDVALIESEMVDTATWAAQNLPPGAVVAAHDIGALGYYDDHPLVDLAGLISPEVVPFMRDQARLAVFLNQQGVRYLIAFPDLYPRLALQATPLHSSHGSFAPGMGGQSMTIYCWSCR